MDDEDEDEQHASDTAWIGWLDAQPEDIDEDVARDAWTAAWDASRAYERALACDEIVRLSELAQGRLEHFQHSEESRAFHFQRAEAAEARAERLLAALVDADARGHHNKQCALYRPGGPPFPRCDCWKTALLSALAEAPDASGAGPTAEDIAP